MLSKERYPEMRRPVGEKPSSEMSDLLRFIRDTSNRLLFSDQELVGQQLSQTIRSIWFSVIPPEKALKEIRDKAKAVALQRRGKPDYKPTYVRKELSRIEGIKLLDEAELHISGVKNIVEAEKS